MRDQKDVTKTDWDLLGRNYGRLYFLFGNHGKPINMGH